MIIFKKKLPFIILLLIILVVCLASFFLVDDQYVAQASARYHYFDPLYYSEFTAEESGYQTDKWWYLFDLNNPIAMIIQVVLSFLGVIFFIIMIYAGFLWMTAGGNEEQLTKAKNLLKNGTIGLLIVLAAYAITYFVVSQFGEATGYETGFDSTED